MVLSRSVAPGCEAVAAGHYRPGVVTAGLLALNALFPPSSFGAESLMPGAIPDSAELAALRQRVSSAKVVRLEGSFGSREIGRPLLDSSGVRSRDWEERARLRPALFVSADAPRPPVPAPIAWSEITEIQTGGPKIVKGALVGTFTGIVLGATLAAASLGNGYVGEEEGFRAIGIFSGTAMTGTIVGLVVGSMRGWHTVYRARQ